MAISKGWKWEVLSKDDEYWNNPDFMIHYLNYRWKNAGFKDFLDIGCGLGRHSIFMAMNGYNVSAFDYSKYVVDIVREKSFERNLNIKLCIGDIANIPFESESIDCMIAIDVLSNSDREGISKILKEMYRVLKVNGETYFNIISKLSDGEISGELFNGNSFYNINENDFELLFKDFNVISIKHVDEIGDNIFDMPSYCVLLKKVSNSGTFDDEKLKDSAYLL